MSDAAPIITYTQDERNLEIKTVLDDSELLPEKFSGTEALSKLFEFRVQLLSTDFSVDLKALLRTSVTVTIYLADGTPRYFNAIVRSATHSKESGDVKSARETGKAMTNPSRELAIYEAILVPKLWLLSLDSNCKIFQEMSVPDIVTQVIQGFGITDYQFNTKGTYPKRDYCVQYRESSLAFISRLLEEEGIYYYFTHEENKHTIVFADKSTMAAAVHDVPIRYAFSGDGWVEEGVEGIKTLERIESAYTGKVAQTDYNFETPAMSLLNSVGTAKEEAFDYPGEFLTKDDGQRYVDLRIDEREAFQFVVNGTSRCRYLQPGYYFTLEGHYRVDTNKSYFLTSVTHECFDSSYRQDDKDSAHYYKNSFSAILNTVVYRPPRITPRPVVKGVQPALVVGKSGEEIWVDKYGRIKVQFYWDRVGTKDENSSCWIRVSQSWAGKNWGWVTHPRMGQEVLVDFLEGDPDRPIVVGRVYNADQMPPYTLPDNQTQSGIKSRSSKGGSSDQYNEIRFEDLTDKEQILIHAQKDMLTEVEHDDTQTIQNDRTINVTGKHTETIIKDTSITISQGNHSTTVSQGNQSITVSVGNQTTNVSMGKIDMTAMQSITLTVGANSIKIDQTGVTIQALKVSITAETMCTVQGQATLILKGGMTMIN